MEDTELGLLGKANAFRVVGDRSPELIDGVLDGVAEVAAALEDRGAGRWLCVGGVDSVAEWIVGICFGTCSAFVFGNSDLLVEEGVVGGRIGAAEMPSDESAGCFAAESTDGVGLLCHILLCRRLLCFKGRGWICSKGGQVCIGITEFFGKFGVLNRV